MKKIAQNISERYDYLWRGDKDTLWGMWLTILMAIAMAAEAVLSAFSILNQ